MDTSEIYLKMCEKAEEIQKLMPKIIGSPYNYNIQSCELGSFFSMCGDIEILINDNDTGMAMIGSYGDADEPKIWLPRQDQLQAMVGGWPTKGFIDWQYWLGHVYGFNYRDEPNGHLHIFTSGEQLWLAFVMRELFHKKWSGIGWEVV